MAKSQTELLMRQTDTRNDPLMKEMVSIRLPRIPGDEQNYVNVGINGIFYQVQRGKTVEVPKPVAEILQNSERMSETADKYLEDLIENRK